METNAMKTAQDSTIANADLWSRYFQEQWSQWWSPLSGATPAPVAEMADGTAARVANFLTLVAAGPIAWLYNSNAPQVIEIRSEDSEDAPINALDIAPDLESVEEAAVA